MNSGSCSQTSSSWPIVAIYVEYCKLCGLQVVVILLHTTWWAKLDRPLAATIK